MAVWERVWVVTVADLALDGFFPRRAVEAGRERDRVTLLCLRQEHRLRGWVSFAEVVEYGPEAGEAADDVPCLLEQLRAGTPV